MQSLRTGVVEVAEIPCPANKGGQLLIRSRCTLVSAGTERMLAEFGKAGWIDKARQQPDKVRMVLDKIRTDGLIPTVESVRNKLEQPLPTGYCNAGVVVEIGDGVTSFSPGDRVASSGKHAELVRVPVNLCAKIPDSVSDEEASFTVLAAVALQGIRLVQPTLGEVVVVTGLGLIGLVTVQLLRAQGCRVLGIDRDPDRLALARQFGAEVVNLADGQDPVLAARDFSRGRGVDAVIITASTKSSEPVHQAAVMCRKRGRIVLVGVTGLELSRADFYEKELSFQVSCSYGPGRYDPNYEDKGHDYPFGFVRWTEQRNFEAVLDMMADGRLDVTPLISHRVAIEEGDKAYDIILGEAPALGVLLTYGGNHATSQEAISARSISVMPCPGKKMRGDSATAGTKQVTTSFVGSGNYATGVLIPAFHAAGACLRAVASSGGVSGLHAARKFGFEITTTDTTKVFVDPEVDAVAIATRHDTHAALVCEALRSNKHVFVEKPLAVTLGQLREVESGYAESVARGRSPLLMVGFNRRFAPQVRKIKSLLECSKAPLALIMTVNAGAIPADHWTQDIASGGGRIVGEACHFIDLLRFLVGHHIESHFITCMNTSTGDTVTIQLSFADGSVGTIHYFANGARAFPKERLEVFSGGRVLQLDNYRKLTGFGWPTFRKMNLWRQDKGQKACASAFLEAVAGRRSAPIPVEELFEVARVTLELAQASR